MKRFLCALVLTCMFVPRAWADVSIDAANFPDDNFRSYVSSNFDSDSDGVLSDSEIAAATSIDVSGQGVSSLKGIEHFTALTTLYCQNNQINGLDVSSNTALTTLFCYGNNLTELNVSSNTVLTTLYCSNNNLTALNLSGSIALTTLYCSSNQLTELDVSNNAALTTLDCSNSQLTELDVSRNIALITLYCFSNKLTELDVSRNTALTYLYCYNNQLTALDLGKNTALTDTNCSSQTISPLRIISTGDSSYPYQLNLGLYMSSNKFANVLNVKGSDSSDTEITTTYSDGVAQFASCPASVTYDYETGRNSTTMGVTFSNASVSLSINAAIFPDSNFRSYITSNFDTDNDGVLSDTEISSITEIQADSQGIQSLSGIENFTALEYLSCGSNDISSLDVSGNTALTYLNFWGNNVSSIDLSKNTALKEIYFYDNNISSVDFSGNTEIISIDCVHNGLRYIDVSGCTKLEFLNVYDNLLTELDVSNCTRLNNLSFGSNDVSEIDLSNNPLITYLGCNENRLATLDLSGMSGDITELYMDSQMIDGMTITGTGDSSYPYQLDFSAYMSPDKFANVSDVQGIDSGNGNITTTYADGIARFASYPSSVQYNYATGYGSILMDVTISGAGLSSGDVEINAENFPDDNFRSYVSTNFDTDGDGVLSASEIADVLDIYVNDMSISSLTGIEHFTALEYLQCYGNQLTALDISKNTALTELRCQNNQLTALDLSKNTALTALQCYNNQLTALDVSSNTALTSLRCQYNQLTALDVSNNTALSILYCNNNQLKVLDVSSNTALSTLDCTSQTVSPLTITSTGDSSYPYQLNFSAYMSSDQFANVSDVQGYDSNSEDITTAYANGVARFASRPEKVTYNYATGFSTNIMDVTISGSSSSGEGLEISAENFPDANFRSYLISNFDTNGDGVLSDSEIANVTHINVPKNGISSLTGVEYFTALTDLDCWDNQLTALDVSKNTALTDLACGGNQLTVLDVSNNTALKYLSCSSNDLTALDVTSNTALTSLYCYSNDLTELDVSKNTALTELYCAGNQLMTLDLSKNTALMYLSCYNNKLKALDVSNNTALRRFWCFSNCMPILDVTSNTNLDILSCDSQIIAPLKLSPTGDSSYPYQLDFSAYMSPDNFANVSNVQGLNSNSADITTTYADGIARFASRPQSVKYNYATAFNSTVMDVTISNPGLNISAANFPDSAFRSYISSNFDSDNNGALSESEISAVTQINVDNMNISSLKGIELFTSLNGLSCTENRLTELDLSRNTALTEVWAMSNDIASLNVNGCTSLRKLGLHGNNLTQLDVSGLSSLEELHCGDMNLSTLIIGNKPYLTQLYCYRNQLTALDVTGCPALTHLHFGGNRISSIDLSRCTRLEYLHCWSNNLTELDLSGLTSLKNLNCSNNALRVLDLSGVSLTEFNADNQSFNAPVIYSTGDSSYPYRADLSAYVTAGNVSNVVNVYAYDSGGSSIGTVYENGTARFASLPSTLTYTYSTGSGNMSVNVSYGNASVTNDTPSVPDTPVTPGPNTEDNPSPIPDESEAVRGQVTVNGHRYALYDIKLTWTDAQAYCESLGGHLATIRTREEQEAISAIILESDAEAYWLGGRRNDSGTWMWLDGSEWNFTNWDTEHGQNGESGELLLIYGPAYSGTASSFYASDETLGTPGKWGSVPANTDAALYGFICEWTQTQTPIETAIVSPITQVTDDLRERLANLVSIDRSEVNFITSAEINPSEAREPTQAMRQSLADQSGEFLAKLNTIKVNKDGWYALVVTVSDDLVGTSVSNLRLFYAEESEFAEGSLSASFGLMPIVNGITGGLEITDLFGVKLDTLPKQFIAMMMLSAGKSLSVYIVKILLMLLAGCSTGAGALIVLVMFIAKRYRKK